jgi:hypothetical protein
MTEKIVKKVGLVGKGSLSVVIEVGGFYGCEAW